MAKETYFYKTVNEIECNNECLPLASYEIVP